MAIESLDRALELFGTPLYVYHEIVHNRPVVERFKKRGVTFVDSIDEIPNGSTVLYSAHGVSPMIREAAASRAAGGTAFTRSFHISSDHSISNGRSVTPT